MSAGFSQRTVETIASGEPGWLKSQRLSAWQTFEKLPLPTRRDVEWQHFDIRALNLNEVTSTLTNYPPISVKLNDLPSDLVNQGVIFCDLPTAIAKHNDLVQQYLGKSISTEERRKFTALHAACWRTGTFLYVPSNLQVRVPLEIVYEFSGQSTAGFPHTLVVVEAGAETTLVQRFIGGPQGNTNGALS